MLLLITYSLEFFIAEVFLEAGQGVSVQGHERFGLGVYQGWVGCKGKCIRESCVLGSNLQASKQHVQASGRQVG